LSWVYFVPFVSFCRSFAVIVRFPLAHHSLSEPVPTANFIQLLGDLDAAGSLPDHVLLSFRNPPGTRHPSAGLTRRSCIVATWLVVVEPAAIAGYSGYVPSRVMAVVHARTAVAARALGGWP
jgi:hypothetical protein